LVRADHWEDSAIEVGRWRDEKRRGHSREWRTGLENKSDGQGRLEDWMRDGDGLDGRNTQEKEEEYYLIFCVIIRKIRSRRNCAFE